MSSNFLYLSEPDTINAGVLDTERCIRVCAEVFEVLVAGDYVMGGPTHNSHGLGLEFPTSSAFPNMPVAGPDRRFVTMPAYVGGRFNVCGNKWYGSNAANVKQGLPRSVLTLMLNDKDTGEPIALMSANLLSAARTGAIPGLAAHTLADPGARQLTIVGCGPINRAICRATVTQLPKLERIVCYDISPSASRNFADWVTTSMTGVDGIVSDDIAHALNGADVVSVAASRLQPLEVEGSWIKDGACVLISGPLKADENLWTESHIVYDHVGLHEAYMKDAHVSPNRQQAYDALIGGSAYSLIDSGKIAPLSESIGLGQVLNHDRPGRAASSDKIVFIASGMAVFDVAWGFDLYQRAREQQHGQWLTLWDQPHLA